MRQKTTMELPDNDRAIRHSVTGVVGLAKKRGPTGIAPATCRNYVDLLLLEILFTVSSKLT